MTQAFNLSQFANKVNSSGQADATSALTGLVPTANLGTGTASATTYLAGDQTYKSFPSVFNGATVTSSAVDITLTSASNQVQQVAMTAYDKKVILPDATTITTLGGPRFVINNNGYIAFDVAVSTGGRLFGVGGGQSVEISLSSNSNATQGWVVTPIGQVIGNSQGSGFTSGTTLLSYIPADINSTNSFSTNTFTSMACVALSTTSVMAVWIAPSTGYPTACVGTISGTTISWGTPAVVNSARAYTIVKMCALSSTTGLISIQSGANFYSVGFSVSGTTLSFSTISVAGGSTVYNIVAITSTTALNISSSGARVVTYNGASAPTNGAGLSITWDAGTTASIVPLTATTFLVGYQEQGVTNNSSFAAFVATVSGTTVTKGTTVFATGSGQTQGLGNVIGISSTEGVFVLSGQWQRWTVSGTTVTAGATNIYGEPWNSANKSWNNFVFEGVTSQLIGSTDFIAFTRSVGIVRCSYNSGSLSAKGYSLCANSCLNFAVCTVSTTRGLVVGLSTRSDGTNNYYPTGYLVDLNG
jgi:hypothetical protein